MEYIPPFPEPSHQVFTVYYKASCPYSREALKLLRSRGILYQAWEYEALVVIARQQGYPDVKTMLQQKLRKYGLRPNHTTFPIVFRPIAGRGVEFIGGCAELTRMLT